MILLNTAGFSSVIRRLTAVTYLLRPGEDAHTERCIYVLDERDESESSRRRGGERAGGIN